MIKLYLESIGLIHPTRVSYDNQVVQTYRLLPRDLVAVWKKCFNLNPGIGEYIYLICPDKEYYAMDQKTLASTKSMKELLEEQGVKCVLQTVEL